MEDVLQYNKDGYLLIKEVLNKNEDVLPFIHAIENAVDQLAARLFELGRIQELYEHEPFEKRFALLSNHLENNFMRWDSEIVCQALYDLIHNPKILKKLEPFLGDEITHNGDFHLRPKLPGNPITVFPWHQDSQYYGKVTQHLHIITVHIPLVDVDENNGCLFMIPGSHHWDLLENEVGQDGLRRTSIDVEKRGTPVPMRMKVGDLLLFHNMSCHGSQINQSENVRWTIDLRYSATPDSHQLDDQQKEATTWFFEKMNRGWSPMIVKSKENITSFAEWQSNRDHAQLPGQGGKLI